MSELAVQGDRQVGHVLALKTKGFELRNFCKISAKFVILPDKPALQARVVEGVTAAGRDDILVQQQLRADRTNRVHGDFSKLLNSIHSREKNEKQQRALKSTVDTMSTPHTTEIFNDRNPSTQAKKIFNRLFY